MSERVDGAAVVLLRVQSSSIGFDGVSRRIRYTLLSGFRISRPASGSRAKSGQFTLVLSSQKIILTICIFLISIQVPQGTGSAQVATLLFCIVTVEFLCHWRGRIVTARTRFIADSGQSGLRF